MKTYYAPTQVRFKCDQSISDTKGWDYGIAYQNLVICACCGGIFEISDCEIIEDNLEWNDLTDNIKNNFIPDCEEEETYDVEIENNL